MLATLALAAALQAAPAVTVAPEPGAGGRVTASVDIAATPAAIRRAIDSCDVALRIVPKLKRCRVVSRDPAGKWDVREHVMAGYVVVPGMTSVFRSDYGADGSIRTTKAGGDLKVSESSWRFEPLPAGGTRVRYESRLVLNSGLPGGLVRNQMKKDIAAAMAGLKREAEAAG